MVLPSPRRVLQVDDLTVDGISDEGDVVPAPTTAPERTSPQRRTARPRQSRTPTPPSTLPTSPSPSTETTSAGPTPRPTATTPTPTTPRVTTLPPTTTLAVSTAAVTTTTSPTPSPTPSSTSSPTSSSTQSTLLPTTSLATTSTPTPLLPTTPLPKTPTSSPIPPAPVLVPTTLPSVESADLPWGDIAPPSTTLFEAFDPTTGTPSTPQDTSFPVSAIVAIVAGVLAVLVTAAVVAYYRRRYRQMSLQYLRNMQSTAWTFDDATVDNDSHAPSGPPRSPSMSIWTNPNRPASEFSSGFKAQWQRHAVPSPGSTADYQARRARLSSLQTEVNHEGMRHNGWYQASLADSSAAAQHPKMVMPLRHGMTGGSSVESLSRLDPAQRLHMNRQGHNLMYDTHQASYISTANDHECDSAISFKSSGGESTSPRPTTKRSTRGDNHLSMSSWDEP